MRRIGAVSCVVGILGLLSCVSTVLAEEGRLNVGVYGGGVISLAGDEAVDWGDSEFDNTVSYGLNMTYRLPTGLTLGLDVQRFTMDLELDGEEVGDATVTPLLFMVGYQSMPPADSGFAFHAYAGMGVSFNSFDEGSAVEDVEDEIEFMFGGDADINIDTDNSFAMALGVGGDYFFNRNFSMNLDARLFFSQADFTEEDNWTDGVFSVSEEFEGDADLNNLQFLIGAKYWF